MANRLTTEQRENLCQQIASSLMTNFDEILSGGLSEPSVTLSLYDYNLPVPTGVTIIDDDKDSANELFVDELVADVKDITDGNDNVELALSRMYEDEIGGSYRVDTVDIHELDDDYLIRLAEIAANHKGQHIDERDM